MRYVVVHDVAEITTTSSTRVTGGELDADYNVRQKRSHDLQNLRTMLFA